MHATTRSSARPRRRPGVRAWITAVVVATTSVLVTPTAAPAADPDPTGFVDFDTFLTRVAGTDYRTVPTGAAVDDPAAYRRMRDHIMDSYSGVRVEHSFRWAGTYYDCVVIDSQPSLRGNREVAAPPAIVETGPSTDPAVLSPLLAGHTDNAGNDVSCADGTVPMRRMTLDDMTGFSSVADYLGKNAARPEQAQRQYAYGRQTVDNTGGGSIMDVWNPDANFSLSQQWYSAGSGAGLQTVEGGWVKYPAKFGAGSVLFVFFTPDNYLTGCYNLECPGFVQTNGDWALGAPFDRYSRPGGDPVELVEQWVLDDGNWWLYLGTGSTTTPIGYYPAEAYRNGPMSRGAVDVTYGGEVAPDGAGWPPMGSGEFADRGPGRAAHQRDIMYFAGESYWADLTTHQTAPDCYTIDYRYARDDEGSHFYYGGPGGASC